jgi:hypothetical protein
MKTYVATQRGYIGRLIEPGETFEYEGKPGSWMKPVADEQSAETAATDKAAEKAAEKTDEKSADKKAADDKAAAKGGK